MHFLAQPSLRSNPEAVADQQHPDHQLWVHRRSTGVAVVRFEVLVQICQIEISINTAKQMVRGHMVIEIEGVKQSVLFAAALSHHAGALPWLLLQLRH
jgi:hypothetical protein